MKLLIFRTILIYLCVLFAMRLMGKRQLGELQPEELVSTILISNLASISIESEEVPVTASLIPLFLIAALELLGSILSFRSQRFFNLMSGRPKTVILNGKIDQNALRTLRLTAADLMEALRGKDVFDPRDVSYAVVETNGSLSVALRPEKEPATLADLGARVQRAQATIPFVLDGQVLAENLTTCGLAGTHRTGQQPASGRDPDPGGQRYRGLFSAEKGASSNGGAPARGCGMKRIYVCIGIVVLLLAAAFYSSFRVQQFAEDISDDIDTAMEDIRNSDLTGARQALAEGAELCDTMREGMNHLLRTQDFTELEAALRAADGHLELNAPEEAFGELRRAQVQVETLAWLSHRIL